MLEDSVWLRQLKVESDNSESMERKSFFLSFELKNLTNGCRRCRKGKASRGSTTMREVEFRD